MSGVVKGAIKKIRIISIAGQEKGYFEYGGSSIVVLTKDTITLSDEIRNRARQGDEIPVHIGEKIC